MPAHSTGLVFDKRFLHHDTGAEATVVTRAGSFQIDPESHPSSTQITRRVKQFLDGSGLTARMSPIAARAATEEELLAYHTREYIDWGEGAREWRTRARRLGWDRTGYASEYWLVRGRALCRRGRVGGGQGGARGRG